MAITHTTAVRTVLADAVVGASGQLATGGLLKLYNGTPPANAQAALSGNTLLSTITGIAFGAAASGVSTVSASTADSSAVGGSGASFFRLTKTDGTVILQGTAGTSGTDLILNSTTVAAGANVSLTGTNTYTASP
jgi:hypothetical protein